MRTIACFIKTFKENWRDWKIIVLAIVFAPFFVYIMYLYIGNSEATYKVLVNNLDKGNYSKVLISSWKFAQTQEGKPILNLIFADNMNVAKDMIKNKNADLITTIPEDFSATFEKYMEASKGKISALINYGDQANIRFMIAASLIDYSTFSYVATRTGVEIPIDIKYETAGSGRKLGEFDLFVPALLVLSVIIILFTAGASIIREVENDTIMRLTLSRLSFFEFMTALNLNQLIIGLLCLGVTLLAAFSVGYHSSGSMILLLLVGVLTCFSVISISIITTCFIRNMFGLLTLGCFPFFILMFFSDCFMPLPKIDLWQIAGNQIYLNDILPTATATRAMNKILNYNSGISEISFELIWIFALSLIYFLFGTWLFKRKFKYNIS